MTELELKFRLDAMAVSRWRAALKAQGARAVRLRARYFDTEAWHLGRGLVSLRLRQEGRRWTQTLKSAGDSPVHRQEDEVSVVARAGLDGPVLNVALHEGSPALAQLRLALGKESVAELCERYATDVSRLGAVLAGSNGGRIEVALDIGVVRAGERSSAICELEFEHQGGPIEDLFELASRSVGEGGLWLSTCSKAQRGECVARGGEPPATRAEALRLPDHADGPLLLRAVLSNALAQVLPNAGAVGDGSSEAEVIHQLRVGLRRLRTALRELSALSARIDPAWAAVLGKTFADLGERRDDQAVSEAMRPLLEAAAAPKVVWTSPAFADTTASVRDPAFQSVLVRLLALAHAPDEDFATLSHAEVRTRVIERLDALHQQVRKEGRHFDRLPLDRQHRLRKRLKRLRYLAEFVRPFWPDKPVERFLKRLKPAQEALGVHNDTAVALERFRQDAATDPRAWFAVGFLQSHLATTSRDARRALRRMGKVPAFWA